MKILICIHFDVIPKLYSYGKDLYPQIGNNPLRIEGPPPLLVINPKPLAVREPPNPLMDSIFKLEKFFTELVVQVTSRKEKHPKLTNQRTNVWSSNCKEHSHLPIECPTLIGTNIINNSCTFCKRNHHVSKC